MPTLPLPEGVIGPVSDLAAFLAEHRYTPNVRIVGQGSGSTFIDIPVTLSAWHPRIEKCCVRAPILLENCGSPLIDDVVVHNPPDTWAITVCVTPEGKPDKGVSWPRRGEEVRCARATLGSFRDVFVEGDGWGWLFEDRVGPELRAEWNAQKLTGSFFNAMRIYGGHTTARQGQDFVLNGLRGLDVFGHYVDHRVPRDAPITPAITLGLGTYGVHWYGRDVEPPVIGGPNAREFFAHGWPEKRMTMLNDLRS